MAKDRLPLTDAICRRALPEEREYALHDSRQPGLSLRVQPCGSRTWIMRLRVEGNPVRRSLGTFPQISVKAARQLANALLAGPASPPKSAVAAPLFALFQQEHETKHAARFKPSGLRSYRIYVARELLPAFGGKRLHAITRPDVVAWFERYSLRRPGGADRALGILRQMIECAKDWGALPADWINPAAGVRQNRRRVVGTFLSEAQMTRLGEVLAERMACGCTAAAVLWFLTLTGLRISEAINLRWRDVHPDRLWLEDSKTGPREVPIGIAVRRFLKVHRKPKRILPRRTAVTAAAPPGAFHRDAVFPLPANKEYESVRSVWINVRKAAGLPDRLRIHDLRHSFASHAVMSGETLLTTSRLLGHSRPQMTARYAHLADDALLAAAERIGALIMKQAGSG